MASLRKNEYWGVIASNGVFISKYGNADDIIAVKSKKEALLNVQKEDGETVRKVRIEFID